MADKLKVLIIGCGNIAGGFDQNRPDDAWPLTHAAAFTRHGGFELAACIDPDAERRQAFRQRWSVGSDHASVADMAAAPGSFDVISICSPTALHHEHFEAALTLAPRLIFCEKPVTGSVGQTADLVRRCEEAGILLAINHTRRWAPDIIRLRQQLAQGAHGQLRSVMATYNKGLLNNGGHMIDLLHMLLGELEIVWAGTPVADFWPADPTVPAVLRTASGVPVHLGTAHAADYAFFEMQIIAERAVIAMQSGGAAWQIRTAIDSPQFVGYKALAVGERVEGEYSHAMAAAAANIFDALGQGAALLSDGHTALEAQRVCASILAASAAPKH